MKTTVAAALTVLLLALAGCGSDSSGAGDGASLSGDDAAAAEAISTSIQDGQEAAGAEGTFAMQPKEADCIGTGFVKEIGADQLQEYGFLTDDLESAQDMSDIKLNPDDAEAASGVLFDCTDVDNMMSDAFAAAGTLDKKTQVCLQDALSEDVLREMFTLMFSGESEEAQTLATEPMMQCVQAPTQ